MRSEAEQAHEDQIERVGQHWLDLLADGFSALGVRRLHGWGDRSRSPARHFDKYSIRPWIDHAYRLRMSDRLVYRAEPYHLDVDDFDDLALLRAKGWHVAIGGYPWHHPTTIVISLERAAREESR